MAVGGGAKTMAGTAKSRKETVVGGAIMVLRTGGAMIKIGGVMIKIGGVMRKIGGVMLMTVIVAPKMTVMRRFNDAQSTTENEGKKPKTNEVEARPVRRNLCWEGRNPMKERWGGLMEVRMVEVANPVLHCVECRRPEIVVNRKKETKAQMEEKTRALG